MTKDEIAKKMAELVQQKDALELRKSAIAKKYNDDIKGVEAQMSELAEKYLHDDQDDLFDGVQEGVEDAEVVDETKQLEDKSHMLPEVTESQDA